LGDADCQFRISQQLINENLGVNDLKNGIAWLIKSSDQGHIEALLNLGFRYISGDGLDKDLVEGFLSIEKAAMAHSKKAQANLSSLYLLGIGVEKNLTMAYAWIRLAELNSRSYKIENLSFTCKLLRTETLTDTQLKHAEEFIKKFSADYSHRYKTKV
jgi:TPR repeat protein